MLVGLLGEGLNQHMAIDPGHAEYDPPACGNNRLRLFHEVSASVCKEVKYLFGPADSLFVELRVTALGA